MSSLPPSLVRRDAAAPADIPPDSSSATTTLVIGVDEAGYGPFIGPLVVGMTMFRVETHSMETDWWRRLRRTVARAHVANGSRWIVDDSKKVLARRDGREQLARTASACQRWIGCDSERLSTLADHLCGERKHRLADEHWREHDAQGYWSGSVDRKKCLGMDVREQGIELVSCRAALVFPAEFNQLLSEEGNKAAVEIRIIRDLVSAALREVVDQDETVSIHVDRLGGRTNYRTLVEDISVDRFVQTIEEIPARSRYVFQRKDGRTVRMGFYVDGDRLHLPIALASMIAKDLRERAMAGLNQFWRVRIPELAPTAGYPTDARRFRKSVEPHFGDVGLTLDQFWRQR